MAETGRKRREEEAETQRKIKSEGFNQTAKLEELRLKAEELERKKFGDKSIGEGFSSIEEATQYAKKMGSHLNSYDPKTGKATFGYSRPTSKGEKIVNPFRQGK